MDTKFKQRVDQILNEFQAGLQTAPNVKKAGQKAKSELTLMDSDLDDQEILKAAASGDKMTLIKALKAKRLRDQQELKDQLASLSSL